MPAEGLPWLERAEILSFEEIERLVSLLGEMGVRDVRLTGGEPLVRRDFPALAGRLCALPHLDEVSVTRSCGPASTVSMSRSTRSSATASSR